MFLPKPTYFVLDIGLGINKNHVVLLQPLIKKCIHLSSKTAIYH